MQICFLTHFFKLRVLASHNCQSSRYLEHLFQQQAKGSPLHTLGNSAASSNNQHSVWSVHENKAHLWVQQPVLAEWQAWMHPPRHPHTHRDTNLLSTYTYTSIDQFAAADIFWSNIYARLRCVNCNDREYWVISWCHRSEGGGTWTWTDVREARTRTTNQTYIR